MFADYVVESSEVTIGITRIGLSLAFCTVAFANNFAIRSSGLDRTGSIFFLKCLQVERLATGFGPIYQMFW